VTPSSHQLKASPKKVVKALLREEYKRYILSFHTSVSVLPEEYLVAHQEPEQARTEKVKAEAQARREARKKKRLRLVRNEEVSNLFVCAGQRNLLRDKPSRMQAREFLDLRTQSEETSHKDPATT
jgi:hypothetical protein